MSNTSEMMSQLRNTFNSGKTKPVAFRVKQLENLLNMYEEKKDDIVLALWKDLKKHKQEAIVMEVDFLVNDLKNTLYHIYSWAKPEYVDTDLANILDTAYIQKEPYGVVLVMGAWNYPIQLTLLPVHGAIATGNCVVIKPSEVSESCAKLLAEIVPKYLDSECYQVFNGGVQETTDLLKEKFDFIFYTGSAAVGKIIHAAANKYLTPVVLELGGKCPCYIDSSVNLKTAAKRILWGKFVNAGQTCVAPDYILCTKEVENRFLEAARVTIEQFFGKNPKLSPDLARIVTDRHFQRLQELLKYGTIALGGDTDARQRYIAPTILTDLQEDSPVLKEEIFGPILPIVNVQNAYDAIKYIEAHEKPLAMYIFSNKKKDVDLLLTNTSSGSVCVNDTLMQLTVDTLPFGGVGSSGMGSYHGKFSFDTFSHKKAILRKNLGMLGEKLGSAKYPPYSNGKMRYLQIMLAKRPYFGFNIGKHFGTMFAFVLGFVSCYFWDLFWIFF